MSLHHPAGAVGRARATQRRRAGGVEAQDTVARRRHAPGAEAGRKESGGPFAPAQGPKLCEGAACKVEPDGAHAAAGSAGATPAAAPDSIQGCAGPQRQAARAGGSTGGAARARGARAGSKACPFARRVEDRLCLGPPRAPGRRGRRASLSSREPPSDTWRLDGAWTMRQRRVSAAFRSLACQGRTSVPPRSRRSRLLATQVVRRRTLLALGATHGGGSPPTSSLGRSSRPDETFHPARSAARAARPTSRDPPRLPRHRQRPRHARLHPRPNGRLAAS